MKKTYQLAVLNDSTLLLYFDVTRMRFRSILAIYDLQHSVQVSCAIGKCLKRKRQQVKF